MKFFDEYLFFIHEKIFVFTNILHGICPTCNERQR